MRVVVIHNVTGATKAVALTAPSMLIQMPTPGFHIVLRQHITAPADGEAMFHVGEMVTLPGIAIGKYGITGAVDG